MLWTILYLVLYTKSAFGELNFRQLLSNAKEQDISASCYKQFKEIEEMDVLFFMRLIDANPGPKPAGLLEGNFNDLGAYDECLLIADESKEIYGKYCLTSLDLSGIVNYHTTLKFEHTLEMIRNAKKKFENHLEARFYDTEIATYLSTTSNHSHFGICMPNKCTYLDIQKVLPLLVDETNCYTKFTNQNMDHGAIIALSIIYFILIIAFCSTLYDIVCSMGATKPRHQLLVAFSLYTNGMKLFKYSTNSDQLGCLHGIKTISMMWVILGHTYLNLILIAPIDNLSYLNEWLDDFKSMFILSATVSVDTFFTVGGLLTVYVFLKSQTITMNENFKMIPMLYLHRYIRLTPAYAVMVLAYGSGLIKYFSDGPMLGILNSSIESCANNWWAALLYVQNYVTKEMCIGQSWYLSVDFQLFILTPFLLIPLKRWPKYVVPSMAVLGVIGMVIPFYIGYSGSFTGIGMGMQSPEFQNYYFQTYTRFTPYIVGMMFGYYTHKIKKEQRTFKFSKMTLCFLWIILVGGLLFCIFDGMKFTKESGNKWVDGLYLGMNRTVWSVIVSFIVLLCCTGNGGAINTFLSLPTFHIISKLSYSMYLTHYIILLAVIASFRDVIHFSNFVAFFYFSAYLLITLIISVIFSLLFESPIIIIEKILFRSRK